MTEVFVAQTEQIFSTCPHELVEVANVPHMLFHLSLNA